MSGAAARWVTVRLAIGSDVTPRVKLLLAICIFLVSFATKSLHAVDLAPLMHTPEQPAGGMTAEHDSRAVSIVEGHGILIPDNQDPADTLLLAHTPGYSIFLSLSYRIAGRNYFTVQLFQNVINSISVVLLFLISGNLLGWRVGVVSGLLAAISHHLSYFSNFILPDSICAFPILLAVYLLVIARRRRRIVLLYGAAGVMIGLACWLRANPMLLGIFIGMALPVLSVRRGRSAGGASLLALLSLVVIAPITIRNYIVYDEFIPTRIGIGINLWEGLGDISEGRVGALSDQQVIEEEAALYGDSRYGLKWSTPDGIRRDGDRVERSLAIIRERPIWFAGSMLVRMKEMLKYSAHAPLLFKQNGASIKSPNGTVVGGQTDRDLYLTENGPAAERANSLRAGQVVAWLRLPVRALQRILKETMLVFMPIGAALIFLTSPRRCLILLLIPLYWFLFQSPLHTEFRYTLPMHYFLFIFVAVGWVLAATEAWNGVARLSARARTRAGPLIV